MIFVLGEGALDIPLIKHCFPEAKYFYGVEPRLGAISQFKNNIKSSLAQRDVQLQFSHGTIQNYPGPAQPVDIIILGHMLYYCIEDIHSVIQRCCTWLTPNGLILLSHSAPNDLILDIGT